VRRSRPYGQGRLALFGAVVLVAIGIALAFWRSDSGERRLTLPGSHRLAWSADPLAYVPSRAAAFTARAVSGSAKPCSTGCRR
jgi:hypothetical protein